MTTHPPHMRGPFFLFLTLAAFFLLAFGVWSAVVFTWEAIPEFDRTLAKTCADCSPDQPVLRSLMMVATSCGGVRANFLIAIVGAYWMWNHHRRRFAFAWLTIACIGGLMDLGFKEAFGRERPNVELRNELVRDLTNPSYPSGHAMGSIVGYGVLGFVLIQRVKSRPRRFALGGLLVIWVVLIGLSRIYLLAHWASDVVGGWLLGLAYTSACLAIYFWRSSTVAPATSGAAGP